MKSQLFLLLPLMLILAGCGSSQYNIQKQNGTIKTNIPNGTVTWKYDKKLDPKNLEYAGGIWWQKKTNTNRIYFKNGPKECQQVSFNEFGLTLNDFRLPELEEIQGACKQRGILIKKGFHPKYLYSVPYHSRKFKGHIAEAYSTKKCRIARSGTNVGYLKCVTDKFENTHTVRLAEELAQSKSNKSQNDEAYKKALEHSLSLKYGKPKVISADYYNTSNRFLVHITSSRGNVGDMLFESLLWLPVEKKYEKSVKSILTSKNFTPLIEVTHLNGKLEITGIEQFKNPKTIVEKTAYSNAYNSISRLNKFVKQYPNSKHKKSAQNRILQLSYKTSKGNLSKLQSFVKSYPRSKYTAEAKSQIEKIQLKEAGYDQNKLLAFVDSSKISKNKIIAQKRLRTLDRTFKGARLKDTFNVRGCTGIYPKDLIDKYVPTTTSSSTWEKISWSGNCRKGLLFARGTLYFEKKGLYVELYGKMKNGFFTGYVKNTTSDKPRGSFYRKVSEGEYDIQFKSKEDYEKYQR